MNTIAIFNEVFLPIAFVSVSEKGGIVTEVQPGNDVLVSDLKVLIDSFKIQPPRLKSETVNHYSVSVEMLPVSPKNENFLSAIAEELDRAGFTAKIIPNTLKSLLKYVSLKADPLHRQEIINEIINTTSDISTQELAELEDILTDIITLKGVQLDA